MKITVELLDALLAPGNKNNSGGGYSEVEKVLYSIPILERCMELLHHTAAVAASSDVEDDARGMLCAVLLRRDIGRLGVLTETTVDMMLPMIDPIWNVFVSSSSSTLGRLMVHVMAELCSSLYLLDESTACRVIRQTLNSYILNTTDSNISWRRRLELLSHVAQRAPIAFWSVTNVNEVSPLWTTNMTPTNDIDLVIWVQAFCAVGMAAEQQPPTKEVGNKIQKVMAQLEQQLLWNNNNTNRVLDVTCDSAVLGRQCLPSILSCIEQRNSTLVLCLEELLSLGTPSLLCQDGLLEFCMGQRNNHNRDISLVCLELISILLPHLHNSNSTGVSDVFGWTVQLLVEGVDDTDISTWDQGDDDDEEEMATHVLTLLETMMTTVPNFLSWNVVESMVLSSEWNQLWAAFQILQRSVYLYPQSQQQEIITASLSVCWDLLRNTNTKMRVQCAALEYWSIVLDTPETRPITLSCSSNDDHHLELLRRLLQMSSCHKVLRQACSTLISYYGTEDDDEQIIKNGPIMELMLKALPLNGHQYSSVVVTTALSTVAAMAHAAQQHFAPYYDQVMPGLLNFCTQFNNDMVLRGTALETATIVGQSTKNTTYSNDAKTLMTMIVSHLTSSNNNNNIGVDYLLAASARIASAIAPEEYAPFVPHVMPQLLSIITNDSTDVVSISDNNINNTDGDGGKVCLPGVGNKNISINTSLIQEKELAVRALYEHAQALSDHPGLLEPYSLMDATIPLLSVSYSTNLRIAAAQATASLLELTNKNNGYYYTTLCLTLVTQMQLEESRCDWETLLSLSESLSDMAYTAYQSNYTINENTNNDAVLQFTAVMKDFIIRTVQRRSTNNNSVEMEIQAGILTNCVDVVGYTLKVKKESFVPIFQQVLLPTLGPLLLQIQTDDERARLAAVCLFDDCVEHCGGLPLDISEPLAQSILPNIVSSSDLELQEASVYGVAQLARHAPQSLPASSMPTLLQRLFQIAQHQPKDDPNLSRLIENSVSALVALCLYPNSPFRQACDKTQLLPLFLSHLPLQVDPDEAKICHQGLIDMVLRGEVDLVSNASILLQVMGDLSSSHDCPIIQQQVRSLFQLFQQRMSEQEFTHLFTGLETEYQNGIREITAI